MTPAEKGRERKRFRRRLASKAAHAQHRARASEGIRMRGCGGMSHTMLRALKSTRVSEDIARKLAREQAPKPVSPVFG